MNTSRDAKLYYCYCSLHEALLELYKVVWLIHEEEGGRSREIAILSHSIVKIDELKLYYYLKVNDTEAQDE